MTTALRKEQDFSKKVLKIENINKELVKTSTNTRIVTTTPERYNPNKKSVEHLKKPSDVKRAIAKKNSIEVLVMENPINLNNFLNERKTNDLKNTNRIEKNRKLNITNVGSKAYMPFETKVLKNKRQNTHGIGHFGNILNNTTTNNMNQKEALKYKTVADNNNGLMFCETLTNSKEKKNIWIDSIDSLDTDMLGRFYYKII